MKTTRIERNLLSQYEAALEIANRVRENNDATPEQIAEMKNLDEFTSRLEPLIDDLMFEIKLRDENYVGKLADYES